MRALLRVAPVYTPSIGRDPTLASELMVDRAALRKIRPDEPTPVVVDHDLERVIGYVREINVFEDVAGGRVSEWFFASCEITDPPEWLKRGGGVSWEYSPLHTRFVLGTEVVVSCVLREVSILTPATKPAEPFARVVWVGESKDSPAAAASTSDRTVAGEVVLGRPERLVRHGIGQVLGVR